jgi:hypothetical protein
LVEANLDVISDPDRIFAGHSLRIPKKLDPASRSRELGPSFGPANGMEAPAPTGGMAYQRMGREASHVAEGVSGAILKILIVGSRADESSWQTNESQSSRQRKHCGRYHP